MSFCTHSLKYTHSLKPPPDLFCDSFCTTSAAASITEPMEAAAAAFFRDEAKLDAMPSKADNDAMCNASIIGNEAECARLLAQDTALSNAVESTVDSVRDRERSCHQT